MMKNIIQHSELIRVKTYHIKCQRKNLKLLKESRPALFVCARRRWATCTSLSNQAATLGAMPCSIGRFKGLRVIG